MTSLINRRRFSLAAMLTFAGSAALRATETRAAEITITPGRTIGKPARAAWLKGYTQSELDDAQARFGLKFPPDLVALYREHRPADGYDWTRDDNVIREMLAWPLEGLLFDVEHNDLWWPAWGKRPVTANERRDVLTAVVKAAPKLIPLLSHRYIPEEPHEVDNPVFSVMQSDIIYYGANLSDYFDREFFGYGVRPLPSDIKKIRFWSEMVDRNT